MLQIFQRQIFQFALQLIQSQFVGEGSIEVGSLLTDLTLRLFVFGVANLAHEVHTVGNHNQDDAHVFSKRQQQVAEVLALNRRTLLVEFLNAHQSFDDGGDTIAESFVHILDGLLVIQHTIVKQDGQDTVALQSDFLDSDEGCLQRTKNRVQSEHIAVYLMVGNRVEKMTPQKLFIVRQKAVANLLSQLVQNGNRFCPFCFCICKCMRCHTEKTYLFLQK